MPISLSPHNVPTVFFWALIEPQKTNMQTVRHMVLYSFISSLLKRQCEFSKNKGI